jgi:PAS domain-containing protein
MSTRSIQSLDFLKGGGEMGALIRIRDWSKSPLGPPQNWPQTLKTTIRLILTCGHPMFVWWGPRLIQFYNDACRASLGAERHPRALGQEGRHCWDEVWHITGPLIEQVMSGRGSTWCENKLLPFTRNGRKEDSYWTFSYSPIDDPTSGTGVGGVLVVSTETTQLVEMARRLAHERQQFAELFEQSPSCIAVVEGPTHVFSMVNPAYTRLIGSRPVLGIPVAQALPETTEQGYGALLDRVYETGIPYTASDSMYRFQAAPNGPWVERIVSFVFQPIRDADGTVTGILANGFDVTDRKRE